MTLRYGACGSVFRPTAVRHFTLSAYVEYPVYLGYDGYAGYVAYADWCRTSPSVGGCTVVAHGAG